VKHFPNHRPARFAGMDCLEVLHRDSAPTWRLFWRVLAMGLIAFAAGAALCVAAWITT
jgi:hypothetical protein